MKKKMVIKKYAYQCIDIFKHEYNFSFHIPLKEGPM